MLFVGNGKAGAEALPLRENPSPNRDEENDGDDDDDDDDKEDDEDEEDGGGASPNRAERMAGLRYESLSRDKSKNTPDDEDEGKVKDDFRDLEAAVVRRLDAIGMARLLR